MKIVTVVGARPQFIKCAPVSREVRKVATEVLVHTGQHYDDNMSAVFFGELSIPGPDYYLGVGSGSHGLQTSEMLKRIEEVLLKERPDIVLVYGDTNSTLAGALAAAKLHIRVAHVEAGLRSFNRRMPEEINRVLTDHISDFLFCPTGRALKNLEREGITKGVHLVGDVMYDAVLEYGRRAEERSKILDRLELTPKSYALATVHRAENADDPQRLRSIFEALEEMAADGWPVIVPVHPRTRKQLESLSVGVNCLQLIDPVSYLDMLLLEKEAKIILTDSGGVQKEAFWFRVPCVTLREETEWVETVESGWNVVVGCEAKRIFEAASRRPPTTPLLPPYGDGHAANHIMRCLLRGSNSTTSEKSE
jgi:UDP-N-acetylglucosamine 2-epimerase